MFIEPGDFIHGWGDVASKITRALQIDATFGGIRFVRQLSGFSDILAHVQHRAARRVLTATG